MTHLPIAESRIGQFRVPELLLRQGACVEVALPEGMDAMRLKALIEQLGRERGVRVSSAGALENYRVSWLDLLRRLSLAQAVARYAGQQVEEARHLCARCGIEPMQRLATAPWTEKKILDAEIAALSSDVIIVSDLGLDPSGQRRFATYLGELAQRLPVAVLVLRHHVGFSTGSWWSHPVEITRLS